MSRSGRHREEFLRCLSLAESFEYIYSVIWVSLAGLAAQFDLLADVWRTNELVRLDGLRPRIELSVATPPDQSR